MEERAQVNIEYLLIIVGAIAIVTVISLYIKNAANAAADAVKAQANQNT
ncbi:MAG: hypothetical protein WC915_03010 [archaeon]|jgi:uncharacterized protein (UPF0333 family)